MVSTLSVSVGLEDIKQCQFPPSHIQLALFAPCAPDACIHVQYTCVCDLGNIECVLFCSFFLPTLVVMEDSQEEHGECGNIHCNCIYIYIYSVCHVFSVHVKRESNSMINMLGCFPIQPQWSV